MFVCLWVASHDAGMVRGWKVEAGVIVSCLLWFWEPLLYFAFWQSNSPLQILCKPRRDADNSIFSLEDTVYKEDIYFF